MADTYGEAEIRGENISRVLKVFAKKKFKLRPLFLNISSSNWTESYYKKDATILTASGTRNIEGIGRLSEFPSVETNFTLVQKQHLKYAAETKISYEDILTNAFDVQSVAIQDIAEAIVNRIDSRIYADLTADATTSGTVAAVAYWDDTNEAARSPIEDILRGIQAMIENNIDTLENGTILLNPHDYASLMMNSKVINNPSFKTADVVSNGRVGQIAGLNIVVSTTVTDDEAMIIAGPQTGTWKSAVGLSTEIEKKGGKHTLISSWEIGQFNIIAPKRIYTITGTEEP